MTRNEALEKIKKLLNLARNEGATEAEAVRAATQAKALMRMFELDEQDVLLRQLEQEDAGLVEELVSANPTAYSEGTKTLPMWIRIMARGVEKYCTVQLHMARGVGKLTICGMEHDVALAKGLLQYLIDACYNSAMEEGTRAERSAFRFAFAAAVQARLKVAMQEVFAATPGTSLVVLDTAKLAALEKRYGPTESTRVRKQLSHETRKAYIRGYEAGEKQSLNRQIEKHEMRQIR